MSSKIIKKDADILPKVVIAPDLDALGGSIVKLFSAGMDDNIGTTDENNLKVDGIKYPLIKLNNKILDKSSIKEFNLSIKNFLPELTLKVEDRDNSIKSTDSPGVNNVITVKLIAPNSDASKKISLDFYILNSDSENGIFNYTCRYKTRKMQFDTVVTEECLPWPIVDESGKHVNPLTTWEVFKYWICPKTGLGLAYPQPDNNPAEPIENKLQDKHLRIINGKTYKDFCLEQISFAGLYGQVLDIFLDQFGYINIIPLTDIFGDIEIDEDSLKIKAVGGEPTTTSTHNLPENSTFETVRMINNLLHGAGINNLTFEKWEIISNPETITNTDNKGSVRHKYYLSWSDTEEYLTYPMEIEEGAVLPEFHKESKGYIINAEDIQIIENSVDGIEGASRGEYEYTTHEQVGSWQPDLPDEVNILKKKRENEAFFDKYFSKQLYVEMKKPNYNLVRGMVIKVVLVEYDAAVKQQILNQWEHALITEPDDSATYDSDINDYQSPVIDENRPLPNPSLSGLWYICSMGYFWKDGDEDICQYLYLAKQSGVSNGILNKYTDTNVT